MNLEALQAQHQLLVECLNISKTTFATQRQQTDLLVKRYHAILNDNIEDSYRQELADELAASIGIKASTVEDTLQAAQNKLSAFIDGFHHNLMLLGSQAKLLAGTLDAVYVDNKLTIVTFNKEDTLNISDIEAELFDHANAVGLAITIGTPGAITKALLDLTKGAYGAASSNEALSGVSQIFEEQSIQDLQPLQPTKDLLGNLGWNTYAELVDLNNELGLASATLNNLVDVLRHDLIDMASSALANSYSQKDAINNTSEYSEYIVNFLCCTLQTASILAVHTTKVLDQIHTQGQPT
jgi:hypothetical protein